jgi:ABC-2 type transport system ATP-binding protein
MIIQTKGLTKLYGSHVGICDLDLQIEKGEIFGFLGPNGAGKTTTIRLILGLIRPTRGKAYVFGKDIAKEGLTIRKQIGNLPGELSLFEELTGQELLDFLGGFFDCQYIELRNRLISEFEIQDRDLRRKIKHYSSGMKQKLGLIQAMQHNPKLLILDEPSDRLDPLMQLALYRQLHEFRENGTTIFFSSHILSEVQRICDRVGIVRAGRLVDVESIDDLKHKNVRRMEVHFRSEPDLHIENIPGVTIERRLDNRLYLLVRGNVDVLLKELAQCDLEDIVYPEPDLEDVFLNFYSEKGGGDN